MKNDVAAFLTDQKDRFTAFCGSCDPAGSDERKRWDCPLGAIETIVWRGAVFEKASAIYCDLEIETPPVLARTLGTQQQRMRALVLEMNLFPYNPRIPKGYMELRANMPGATILAGGTDLFPYDSDDEAGGMLAARLEEVCSRHGQDYQALRAVRADFFKSKYTGAKVGSHAGIYFFFLEERHFPFYRDMAAAFYDVYADIVGRRGGAPPTAQERQHMLRLHGQWAQWILLEDDGTRFGLDKGIPAEALLGAILPPLAAF